MEGRQVIRASGERSEVDISRALIGQGRNADFAKEMQAVRRDPHSDLLEVVDPEARQLAIGQVLDGGEIPGLMLCPKDVSMPDMRKRPWDGVQRQGVGQGKLQSLTPGVVAETHQRSLQLVLYLIERLDGLLPWLVRVAELNSVGGGLVSRSTAC